MSGVAFVCSAWLTVALINVEAPVQRAITTVNVGNSRSILYAVVLVVLSTSAFLAVLMLALPDLLGNHGLTALDLVAGGEALLTASCFGIAIGMITSRLVIRRMGFSLIVALILLVIFLLARWVPPLNRMILVLANNDTATGGVVLDVTVYTAISLVVLVACTAVTQLIASRRD
jgi:hypothetical protein